MKKLLIEHPGTAFFNELSHKLRHMLEFDLGYETETIVGENNGNITVMTEGGMDIFSTNVLPSLSAVKLYVSLAT